MPGVVPFAVAAEPRHVSPGISLPTVKLLAPAAYRSEVLSDLSALAPVITVTARLPRRVRANQANPVVTNKAFAHLKNPLVRPLQPTEQQLRSVATSTAAVN